MDKRINYLIGLDTETCNGIVVDNKLDLSQSLVYDLGWAIVDKKGRIYKTRSFVVAEIFVGMKDVMTSAYYADKIPTYWEDIKNGQRILASFWKIWKTFKNDAEEYGVTQFFAHNARFDVNALNNTVRYLSKSKCRYFFPYNAELWDTLKMARQTIGKQISYKRYCINNSFMTKHKVPQVRLTAEVLYKYISGDIEFSENHTGLEDVLIETAIMAHCFRQHKKMEKRLWA